MIISQNTNVVPFTKLFCIYNTCNNVRQHSSLGIIYNYQLKMYNVVPCVISLALCNSSSIISLLPARKNDIIRSTELLLEAISSSDFESYAYVLFLSTCFSFSKIDN